MKLEDFKTALIHYVKEMDEYYGMTEKETAKTVSKIQEAKNAEDAFITLCNESNIEACMETEILLKIFVPDND
jgi:hypothetical protein